MEYVIKHYHDSNGNKATISQEKYCTDYKLLIHNSKTNIVDYCDIILNKRYTTIKTAKQAMKRISNNWTEEK